MEKKIKYIYSDCGHWLARCNHNSNIIEINGIEFPNLSPLLQDYVWVHEHVHLLADVHDESKCNEIADAIFVKRSSSSSDLQARRNFLTCAYTMTGDETISRQLVQPDNRSMKSDKKVSIAVIVAVIVLIIVLYKTKKK